MKYQLHRKSTKIEFSVLWKLTKVKSAIYRRLLHSPFHNIVQCDKINTGTYIQSTCDIKTFFGVLSELTINNTKSSHKFHQNPSNIHHFMNKLLFTIASRINVSPNMQLCDIKGRTHMICPMSSFAYLTFTSLWAYENFIWSTNLQPSNSETIYDDIGPKKKKKRSTATV